MICGATRSASHARKRERKLRSGIRNDFAKRQRNGLRLHISHNGHLFSWRIDAERFGRDLHHQSAADGVADGSDRLAVGFGVEKMGAVSCHGHPDVICRAPRPA